MYRNCFKFQLISFSSGSPTLPNPIPFSWGDARRKFWHREIHSLASTSSCSGKIGGGRRRVTCHRSESLVQRGVIWIYGSKHEGMDGRTFYTYSKVRRQHKIPIKLRLLLYNLLIISGKLLITSAENGVNDNGSFLMGMWILNG